MERLDKELLGWLTTIDPAGQPQASAVWFLWRDGEILVFSGKRARRNDNLAEHRLVGFNHQRAEPVHATQIVYTVHRTSCCYSTCPGLPLW